MRGGGAFLLIVAGMLTACSPQLKLTGPTVQEPILLEMAVTLADGIALPLRIWPTKQEPKAILLALHGFNDYGTFIKDAAGYFSERGVQVYAYDQRGFGEAPHRGFWPGKEAFAQDLSATTKLLKARHKKVPLYLLGVSMGGAVIMTAMTSDDPPSTAGVILAAPAVWGRKTQPFYQRWGLALAVRTIPWMKLSGRGLNIKPSDNIPMLRALGRDPLVIKETRIDTIWGLVNLMDAALESSKTFDTRALILYGDNDEIIRQEPTDLMLSQLPKEAADRQTLKRYGEGYHMLLRGLNAEIVWKDILEWMAGT